MVEVINSFEVCVVFTHRALRHYRLLFIVTVLQGYYLYSLLV